MTAHGYLGIALLIAVALVGAALIHPVLALLVLLGLSFAAFDF